MCGILAILYSSDNRYKQVKKAVGHLVARGPEGTQITELPSATFAFTRLAINGLHEGGMQPFYRPYATWMCNGEIYNSKSIEQTLGYEGKGSDCEVLGNIDDVINKNYQDSIEKTLFSNTFPWFFHKDITFDIDFNIF
jgi:asparagine synthetase B (glutamine-hydrolysing)